MAISHVYTQTVADGTATSVVRPSDWNSGHALVQNISGNTAGTSQVSGLDIVWAGGSNVTLSANGSTVSVVGASQSVQTQASGNIAGIGLTTTSTGGVLIVGTNSTNGLSLGVPNFLTTQSVQTQASGAIAGSGLTTTSTAGANLAGTLNSAGISLGVPVWLTTQSVQTQASGNIAGAGFTSTSTAGLLMVGTHNSAGLSVGVPNWLTTQTVQTQASGAIAGSGFTSTSTGGSVPVATLNSAGLSMGIPAWLTTSQAQTNQTIGAYATGNTTAQSSSTTFDARSLSVSGVNISVGYSTTAAGAPVLYLSGNSTQSVQTQASGGIAGTGTTFGGTNVSASLTLNSVGLQMSLSGGAGTTNQTGPNIAAGTQTATSGTVVFSNSNSVTFGMSNSSVITASVGQPIVSYWIGPDANALTFVSAPVNASVSVNMFPIPDFLSGTRVELPIYQSISSSGVGNTYGQQWSIYVGIFTNDTANNRLMSLSSGSTQTTYTVASNTAGQTQINGSGVRPISCPINYSMTPGIYFIAVNWVTNTFSSGTASTALNRTVSIVGNPQQSASFAMVGDYSVATAATNNSFMPMGVFSAASTGIPTTISYSQMTMTGASRSQANFALIFRN